jgi:hypothetical protein
MRLVIGEAEGFPPAFPSLFSDWKEKKKMSPVNFMTAVSKVFYPNRSKYSNEVWKESHL